MQILALDVGTSSVKAVVVDSATARPLGPVVHQTYPLHHPTPEAVEVVAEELWETTTAAARLAGRDFPGVEGIGLSVMTPALVLLDKNDRPLGPIWTHLDRRARAAARQVWAAVGEEFLATTGNRPLPGGISAVCYRQQLNDDPYICHRVRSYLHLNGWLSLQLTGERAFDPGNACDTGLFGTLTDRQWSDRWCDYFEVDRNWLPPIVPGNTTVGTLRSAAAAECSLTAGIPVKLGMPDTSCAVLAAQINEDELLHVVGTTQLLACLVRQPVPSPRLLTRLLGVGDIYLQAIHNPVGGVALEWLRQLCFRDQTEEEYFHRTIPAAAQRSTKVLLDPAYLGGDRLEIEAHRAAFRELTLTSDRLDLLVALLQAMQRCQRDALAALGGGRTLQRIVLTGGGAELVHRLLPEYATAKVEMMEEGSLRGAARLFEPLAG
jgi:sugar (pentulose or hexulose) kinase